MSAVPFGIPENAPRLPPGEDTMIAHAQPVKANPMTDAIAVKHTGDLLERLRKATGPDREIDGQLMCMENGWRFIRFSRGGEFGYPYQDREPSPNGPGGAVHPGTMIYFNPDPGNANHYQQYTPSGLTPYTASVDVALALVERCFPEWAFDVRKGGKHVEATVRSGDMDHPCWALVSEDGYGTFVSAPTLPLAILTALLSAISRAEGHYHE